MITEVQFAKGHGTQNDFVVVAERDDTPPLTDEQVRWLCDRHAGIGGDGLLRAVRGEAIAEWDGDPAVWFMDYRNADGSIAPMCGNGLRVFVRYLLDRNRISDSDRTADGSIRIGTRAGLRSARELPDGQIRVGLGRVRLQPQRVNIHHGGRDFTAIKVDVGTPHAVVFTSGIDDLDLHHAPGHSTTDFPDGVNVEFAEVTGAGQVRMRVHERGVGETRSCGTGTVAVAAAANLHHPAHLWQVQVPGGTVTVELPTDGDREAYLTGTATIVGFGVASVPV